MARIVVNPNDLADTASLLHRAAGELEAVGTRVAACDCGCMPMDVAATVDGVTAAVRSRLQGVSSALAENASELNWRAGVPQSAGFGGTAASAAWGGAATSGPTSAVVGGTFDIPSSAPEGYSLVVGGSFDLPASSGEGYTQMIGGTFDLPVSSSSQGYNLVVTSDSAVSTASNEGYTFVVGGNFDLPAASTGEGYNLVIGGDYSVPSSSQGYSLVVGGDFDLGSSGTGEGYTLEIPGWQMPTGPSDNMMDNLSYLYGMAADRGDFASQGLINSIIGSQQRAAGIWTLPAGWGYVYSPWI